MVREKDIPKRIMLRRPHKEKGEVVEGTAPKRPRLQNKDVTVVVGGHEFQHYRDILCFTCDYFDAALNSGMKETETKRFEFPDKDPNEWEIFSSLLEPFSTTTVDESNVQMLLPWADMLGARQVLSLCDDVFYDRIVQVSFDTAISRTKAERIGQISSDRRMAFFRAHFSTLVQAYGPACRFGLEESKEYAAKCIATVISEYPDVPDEGLITQILSLASLDEEYFKAKIWKRSIKSYLPASLKNEEPMSLISNGMLATLLAAQMKGVVREKVLIKEKSDALEGLQSDHRALLRALPKLLHDAIPGDVSCVNDEFDGLAEESVRGYARRKLRGVILDKWPTRRAIPREPPGDYHIRSS